MIIENIPVGKDAPWDVNVIIEVPAGGEPVKYEMDKDSGALYVDRILHTSMRYPADYGFIPQTLSGDGDPADVLVIGQNKLVPGCVIAARPIGVLLMEDDGGEDEKIVAVPASRIHPYYDSIKSYKDLPQVQIEQIQHFFERYKDLEKGKWAKITGWADADIAAKKIEEAIERYKQTAEKVA